MPPPARDSPSSLSTWRHSWRSAPRRRRHGPKPRSIASGIAGSCRSSPSNGNDSVSATRRADSPEGPGARTTSRRSWADAPTRALTLPAAAIARTCAGSASTVVVAAASASCAAGSSLRGRSTTTRWFPRWPARSTSRMISGRMVSSLPRSHDITASSPTLGSAALNDEADTRPTVPARSGQRRPSLSSAPTARSIPPPSGSPSTSSTRNPRADPVIASPAASVVAPAPPQPPTTATVRHRSPEPSTTSANLEAICSCALPTSTTSSAPIRTAHIHRSAVGASSVATTTLPRRTEPDAASVSTRSAPTTTRRAVDKAW